MKYEVIDGKGLIPDGATKIEESAFKGCACLQSIVIPDSVTKIGKSAFDGCTSLQSIVIPNSAIILLLQMHPFSIDNYHNSRNRS